LNFSVVPAPFFLPHLQSVALLHLAHSPTKLRFDLGGLFSALVGNEMTQLDWDLKKVSVWIESW
jgi:hypothetical protein